MQRYQLFALAFLCSVALVPDLAAQGRGQTRGSEGRNSRPAETQQRRSNDPYDDRHERYDQRSYKKQGPKFCSSGAGHPVHGRQWCYEKGYRVGTDDRYDDRRYPQQRTLGDIIFGRDRRDYPTSRRLSERDLGRLLGTPTLSRIEREARRLGYRADLTGQWQTDHRADRLQLFSAGHRFADLIDTNRDGRVDAVRFAR